MVRNSNSSFILTESIHIRLNIDCRLQQRFPNTHMTLDKSSRSNIHKICLDARNTKSSDGVHILHWCICYSKGFNLPI